MMIDKIYSVDPVKNLQGAQNVHKNITVKESDTVTLSAEAQQLSELRFAIEAVNNAPDVRTAKIAEVSKKLKDPSYVNDALLNSLADKILDAYGF